MQMFSKQLPRPYYFWGLSFSHFRNYNGMGTGLRRNDFWNRLGGQALVLIGWVALNTINQS